MKKEKIKMPWVFWITLEKREWFSRVWKTRGANFLALQIFNLHISIGMPWENVYLNSNMRDYSSLKNIKLTNDKNLKEGYLIGSYKSVKHLI